MNTSTRFAGMGPSGSPGRRTADIGTKRIRWFHGCRAVLVGFALALASSQAAGDVWFDDLAGDDAPAPLAPQRLPELAEAIHASFSEGRSDPRLPDWAGADASPRIVFLSVSNGQVQARVAMGAGASVAEAVEVAYARLRPDVTRWRVTGITLGRPGAGGLDADAGATPTPAEGQAGEPGEDRFDLWLRLDVVDHAEEMSHLHLGRPLPARWEQGLDGAAFSEASGLALLAQEIQCFGLVSRGNLFDRVRVERYVDSRRAAEVNRDTSVDGGHRFRTSAVFTDGRQTFALYRGRRVVTPEEVTPARLESSLASAQGYFIGAVEGSGRFRYQYEPITDANSRQYNILRHSGTIWSMVQLYELSGSEALIDAADRAMGYLQAQMKPYRVGGREVLVVVERGEVKLGGAGLALLAMSAFAEATQSVPLYRDRMRQLAEYIVRVQARDGRFSVHKHTWPAGRVDAFRSLYYPGEAQLALLHLHAMDGSSRWLDAAKRNALYLIRERDADLPIADLEPDHWLLYSLNELYRHDSQELYIEHAMRIGKSMALAMLRRPTEPDFAGGVGLPPRSTPTASNVEGLASLYRLLDQAGRADQADGLVSLMRWAASFQLRTQIGPEIAMFFPEPRRALGGFSQRLDDFQIRVDGVQHNVSALIALRRIMLDRETAGRSNEFSLDLSSAPEATVDIDTGDAMDDG